MNGNLLISIVAGGLLAWAITAYREPVPREIDFGIVATESHANRKASWESMLEDMSERIGIPVRAFFAPDDAAMVDWIRSGKVQVAWFGGSYAMEAIDRAQGEVFVRTLTRDGASDRWCLLVIHEDSPLEPLEDVEANETGRLAVANRQLDAVAGNAETVAWSRATHPPRAGQVREFRRSPPDAADPLVWRKDLHLEMKARIRAFFLTYGKGEGARKLAALGLSGFRAPDDGQTARC